MKTAVVPNSPELTALMEVTADLSVSLECYENYFRKRYTDIIRESIKQEVDGLAASDAALTNDQMRIVSRAIKCAVHAACIDQATLIKCHESTLGMVGQGAPAELALEGCRKFTESYWNEVSS